MLKDGEDRSSALEAANLEALMKQRERLHAKALEDKRRRLRKLAADVSSRSAQNQEVAVHLVTLGKVLEEQQRLQAGMQSANDQATRWARAGRAHARQWNWAKGRSKAVNAASVGRPLLLLHLMSSPLQLCLTRPLLLTVHQPSSPTPTGACAVW
mgnify:CR=1 FL=1